MAWRLGRSHLGLTSQGFKGYAVCNEKERVNVHRHNPKHIQRLAMCKSFLATKEPMLGGIIVGVRWEVQAAKWWPWEGTGVG